MKYELKQSLGSDDARFCNDKFNASLSLKAGDLAIGETVTLPESAYKWLTEGRGYVSLLEPVEKVKGESKKPELTAPAK